MVTAVLHTNSGTARHCKLLHTNSDTSGTGDHSNTARYCKILQCTAHLQWYSIVIDGSSGTASYCMITKLPYGKVKPRGWCIMSEASERFRLQQRERVIGLVGFELAAEFLEATREALDKSDEGIALLMAAGWTTWPNTMMASEQHSTLQLAVTCISDGKH